MAFRSRANKPSSPWGPPMGSPTTDAAATASHQAIKLEQVEGPMPCTSFDPSQQQQSGAVPPCPPPLSAPSSTHSPMKPPGFGHTDQVASGRHADQQSHPFARARSPAIAANQAAAVRSAAARGHTHHSRASSAQPSSADPMQHHPHFTAELGHALTPLARVPISWGSQKPRTRRQTLSTEASTTDLAAVAAAAVAEAEQAAASAVAKAGAEFDEAASQSGLAPLPTAKRRGTRNGFHSRQSAPDTHPSLLLHPVAVGESHGELRRWQESSLGHPPNAGILCDDSLPSQVPADGYWHDSPPRQSPPPGSGTVRTKGGPRTGRNHHRAGASPSNLTKSLGYIGSTYLGVNGVRHSPEFPLRWRAGTWDPLVRLSLQQVYT